MSNWKISEKKAYQWFKDTIDANAVPLGGADSTKGDIYSPKYNSYIEVKDITRNARCGQFTESTIKDNPFATFIYDGSDDIEICKNFIKYHYEKKKVSYFIVVDGNKMNFYNVEEFLANHIFEVQCPYAKRSGTSQAPQKDIPALLNHDAEFFLANDNRVYCSNEKRRGEYVSIFDAFDYFISKINNGELRKRSPTKNMTWHLIIKRK